MLITCLSSFLSLSQLALCVLLDTLLSGVYSPWNPFICPTSNHKWIIALPRTCHHLYNTEYKVFEEPSSGCMCVCVCVWVRGTADALMMLIIHTADVRLAAEVLPLGNAWTSNSLIVVKSICVFCKKGCALQSWGVKRTERGSCRFMTKQ